MKTIKVAVFEDNKPRRELLEMLIDTTDNLSCTGAYEDCREVVKNISKNIPDIILMDIDMPNVNGIEGLKLVKSQYPGIKVLMQTIFEDEKKIFEAIVAGADGYILKKASPEKLTEAIFDAADGGAPMTPVVAKQVLWMFNNNRQHSKKNEFDLTKREHEILSFLVQGYSYKMIAEKCNVSYATINSHISHIYEKLHVSSGTEAVAKAIENKIV